MSRLLLWKAKIPHLESFQGLPYILAFLLALVWDLFLILIPSFLGHPVWRKRVRYPHPEDICPFLTGSVGTVELRDSKHCGKLQRIFQKE